MDSANNGKDRQDSPSTSDVVHASPRTAFLSPQKTFPLLLNHRKKPRIEDVRDLRQPSLLAPLMREIYHRLWRKRENKIWEPLWVKFPRKILPRIERSATICTARERWKQRGTKVNNYSVVWQIHLSLSLSLFASDNMVSYFPAPFSIHVIFFLFFLEI